jgi:glycosyltransferase involved in cell wall biosynthesis
LAKKKLLMLITELTLGGAEKVFYDHVQAFSETYDVSVCLFTKAHHYEGFRISNPVFVLDDVAISQPLKRWQYRKKRLKQILREGAFDICISHMEGPNFLNASTRTAAKKILVVHGSVDRNSQKSARSKFLTNKILIPLLYKRANRVVTVSHAIRDEHLQKGLPAGKVVCINNFFSLADIRQKAQAETELDAILEHHPVLITVGRLAPEKNQTFLLHLLAHLHRSGRTERLVVVGAGGLKQHLLDTARSLNLTYWDGETEQQVNPDAAVYFTGARQNPYPYIARAQLFLMSSLNEGFPLVLGEALACGTPVVSVDCPSGPRELLAAPNEVFDQPFAGIKNLYAGNLVEYFSTDPDLWQQALDAILQDPQQAQMLSEHCKIKAEQYDKPVILKAWHQLIDHL